MKKTSETIVFFGSGPVAAQSLSLLANNFGIEAVITKPKPDHHKGDFPVVELTNSLGLNLHTASNKHELSALFKTKPLQSKLAVLIDFGIIVTKDVIDYFPLGIVNSHFSLLPEWRGADPITFSILSGQPKTGVSLMLIDEGMDTGKILTQHSLPIEADDTTASLTDKLIALSDDLLVEYLPKYISGNIKPRNQSHPDRATYSRKLTKRDGEIDWSKEAEVIEREIRAYIEWPRSYSQISGKDVVITRARAVAGEGAPGEITVMDKDLLVFCGKGALLIERLKPAGKNEMNASAFINGYMTNI